MYTVIIAIHKRKFINYPPYLAHEAFIYSRCFCISLLSFCVSTLTASHVFVTDEIISSLNDFVDDSYL